jgi:hypothetical protein
MKLRPDKWTDRGEVDPDPMRELERRVARLDYWRDRFKIMSDHADSCEREERENEAITEREFLGVDAFDTAEKKRAEKTARAVAARKERDRVANMVKVGEQSCEQQVLEICGRHTTAAEEEREHLRAEIEAAHARIAALSSAEQLTERRIESYSYGGTERLKLQALFSSSAQRWLENRTLQREVEREFPPETAEQQQERVVDTALSARTIDDSTGAIVPAYTRLSDGGAVRIG